MTIFDIQRWGRAPTPLLPGMLVAELGHLAAPSSFNEILGEQTTLGTLNHCLWNEVDSVSKNCLRDIAMLVGPRLLSLSHLPIMSGEPLNQQIQYLPLSPRTRSCVSKYLDHLILRSITIGDVLSLPGIGQYCAIEFASVVEAAREHLSEGAADGNQIKQLSLTAVLLPEEIDSAFRMLAAYAAGERNLETLTGVLPDPLEDWPPEIKHQWGLIGKVGSRDLARDMVRQYSVPELMSRGLELIDDRSREILVKRVLSFEHATSLEGLGSHYGITKERVRQLEKKAVTSLDQFRNIHYRPVLRRAQVVREQLGVGVPADDSVIKNSLEWSTKDIDDKSGITAEFAQAVMLWLAGPYYKSQDWLLAEENLEQSTIKAILSCRNDRGIVTVPEVNETLTQFGFNERFHGAWIVLLGKFMPVEEGYIYISGNILDKARMLLLYYNRPMSVEEMMELLGSSSIRSFRQRLINDPGFWRINKQSEFVLAGTAGYDEYTGITGAIVRELEASGGQVPFAQLVEKLTRVYGVKEHSVVAYINTPLFAKDVNGVVSARDESTIAVSTDIDNTAACYQAGDGTWYWRVLVKKNLIRGSGCSVPNAFAQVLGCNIGDKIEVDTVTGPLTLSWALTAPVGASIGSLRAALVSCQAEIGDFLFVQATKPAITFKRLNKEVLNSSGTDLIRLSLLIGCVRVENESEALAGIASILKISSTSVGETLFEAQRRLKERGEPWLAELLPSPNMSIDDYISNTGKP